MDFPPVPFLFIKSPPCAMNCILFYFLEWGGGEIVRDLLKLQFTRESIKKRTLGMILWKGLPAYPNPCWPVASSRKLRAVLGTLSSNSLNMIRPEGFESIAMSNFFEQRVNRVQLRLKKKKNNRFCKNTHEYIRPREQRRSSVVEHCGREDGAVRVKYKFLPAEAEVAKRRRQLAIFPRNFES